jgi:hypothetical protein
VIIGITYKCASIYNSQETPPERPAYAQAIYLHDDGQPAVFVSTARIVCHLFVVLPAELDGFSRQREKSERYEERQLDYTTSLAMKEATRAKHKNTK